MKPRTYFGVALLFPYLFWVICALMVAALSLQDISSDWNMIVMPIFFYTFGIFLWFLPYTLLAIGLWIWSRNKSTAMLYKLALVAPILLSALMLIEVVLVLLPAVSVAELAKDMLGQSALMGGFSLVFGYLNVGIALGVFKFLQSKQRITQEMPAPVSEANQAPMLS